MKTPPFYYQGFTLIECCLVLASLSLLICGWVNTFTPLAHRHQQALILSQLEQSIHLAKNEALAKQAPMLLCGSRDGQTCTPDVHWGPHWLLAEANPAPTLSTIRIKTLLRVYTLPKHATLTFHSFKGGASFYLVVLPDGRTHHNGTFTYAHPTNPDLKSTLTINNLLRSYRT